VCVCVFSGCADLPLNSVPFSLYYLCKFCYYMSRNLGTRSLNLPSFQTIPL